MSGQRVVLVDPEPLPGGHHESYAELIASGLCERGDSVYLIGPPGFLEGVRQALPDLPGEALELHPQGLKAYHALSRLPREWRNLIYMLRALRLARSQQADVLHWLYLDGFLLAVLGAVSLLPTPMRQRATLHAVYFAPPFRQPSWPSLLLYQVLLRVLQRMKLRIFVHDDVLVNSLHRFGFDAVDVVPYSVPPPALGEWDRESLRREWRSRLGFGPEDVVLLAFGGTRREKGVDIAIRALAELPESYCLLVAGSVGQFSEWELRELAARHGVQDRVVWRLRFIPEAEVAGYFVASDQVVLPYRPNFSGQSGPLTIAASLGVPVVASEVGVLAGMVRRYSLGACFPAGDYLAMAQAVRRVQQHSPAPDTAGFVADHRRDRFMALLAASYARER